MLFAVAGAGAQGGVGNAGSGWWTVFQIQNLEASPASLVFVAYGDSNQHNGNPDNCEIPSLGSLIFNPNRDGNCGSGGNRLGIAASFPSSFEGSVVASSNNRISAVVQVGNNTNGSGGVAGGRANAFYQGTGSEATDTKLLFPSAKNNFFGQTTSFYIQAVGDDIDVTATYNMDNNQTYNQTISINENESALFDLAGAGVPGGQGVGGGSIGSATFDVTSGGGKIAGAVVEYRNGESPAQVALATKGFTTGEFDTTIIAPTTKLDFFGGNTGFQILNTTGQAATVDVTFTVTNIQAGTAADSAANYNIGDKKTTQITIPANGTYLFSKGRRADPGNLDAAGILPGTFAAAIAVSNQPIVGTINENNGPNRLIYSAFPAGQAKQKLALPLVKEAFFGGTTGVAVQNVSPSNPTDITVTYTDQNGVNRNVGTFTLQGGAAMSFIRLSTNWSNYSSIGGNTQVPGGTNNAVIISSSSEPIVALAQESGNVDTRNYESSATD
jgi:hypothetical protein